MSKSIRETQFNNFVSKLIKKIHKDKPFYISFDKEKYYVSRDLIDDIKDLNKQVTSYNGGTILEVFANLMLPKVFDMIVKKGKAIPEAENFIKDLQKELPTRHGGSIHEVFANFILPKIIKGNALPLAAIIPIVAGVLGAAGGVTGGISSAVKTANDKSADDARLKEQHRHNIAMEKAARGESIYKGKSLTSMIDDFFNQIKGLTTDDKIKLRNILSTFSPFVKFIEDKDGAGIYLSPRRHPKTN